MCGIDLVVDYQAARERVHTALDAMARAQRHRGPDDEGTLIKPVGDKVVGLGQQRLSIIDLSRAAHQPMVSPCGRYALIFNGQVYNYKDIAQELAGDPVLSVSRGDTAVVLASLIRWGADAVKRFNGMWALAFLDCVRERLVLSRDRLGVKPLYYAHHEDGLVVASEIKGVLAGSGERRFSLDRNVVGRFLLQSLLNAQPETFFSGVNAFPPASYAEIDLKDRAPLAFQPRKFWQHPHEEPRGGEPVSAAEVREIFIDSVRLRLRADVPVGIMLSGGLDSSSILAAARQVAPATELRALSVISRDPATNEEPFVDCMASHVGCNVTKVQTDDDPVRFWEDLQEAVWYMEHPFSSFSAVAHREAIRRGRDQGLIVMLTGQGSDEQLGGYGKFLYFYLHDRLRRGRLSGPISMLMGCVREGTVFPEFRVASAKRYIPFLRAGLARSWLGPALADADVLDTGLGASYEEREWRDLRLFSLPALLLSEDRMSMSRSVEMRTPFLDYRLVEALGRTSPEKKLVRGWTKHILREAMSDLLPPEITWRKDKKGYSVPGGAWMRGALKPRVAEVLKQPMLSAELGFVHAPGAQTLFDDLLAHRPGVQYEDVLRIVTLEFWLRRFRPYIDTRALA